MEIHVRYYLMLSPSLCLAVLADNFSLEFDDFSPLFPRVQLIDSLLLDGVIVHFSWS